MVLIDKIRDFKKYEKNKFDCYYRWNWKNWFNVLNLIKGYNVLLERE